MLYSYLLRVVLLGITHGFVSFLDQRSWVKYLPGVGGTGVHEALLSLQRLAAVELKGLQRWFWPRANPLLRLGEPPRRIPGSGLPSNRRRSFKDSTCLWSSLVHGVCGDSSAARSKVLQGHCTPIDGMSTTTTHRFSHMADRVFRMVPCAMSHALQELICE